MLLERDLDADRIEKQEGSRGKIICSRLRSYFSNFESLLVFTNPQQNSFRFSIIFKVKR